MIDRPCDNLKELDDCPNYGSSDCPITMKDDRDCRVTKEWLQEIGEFAPCCIWKEK